MDRMLYKAQRYICVLLHNLMIGIRKSNLITKRTMPDSNDDLPGESSFAFINQDSRDLGENRRDQ